MPDKETGAAMPEYAKSEILASSQFSGCERDLLAALLEENRAYSIERCRALLKKEQGREIK